MMPSAVPHADAADEWLTGLFDQATGGESQGWRSWRWVATDGPSLCPFSDLDVVLVHRGREGQISATAERIWYPVWDDGISLDHSVRRPGDALEMAAGDLRVSLGLLDARVICGDAKVAAPMLEGAHDRWVKQKPPWLRVLGLISWPSGTDPSATWGSSSNRISRRLTGGYATSPCSVP